MKRIALLITALIASSSFAATLTLTGIDLAEVVTVHGVLNEKVYAGRLNFHDSEYGNVKTYCVDLMNQIQINDSYHVSHGDSQNQNIGLRAAGNIIANGYSQANTASKAAGLQLAVWEAIYDGGNSANFKTGHLRVDASDQTLAYATHFYDYRNKDAHARFYSATCKGQSQMDAVPEPASIAALLIGGAGLLRRRSKK